MKRSRYSDEQVVLVLHIVLIASEPSVRYRCHALTAEIGQVTLLAGHPTDPGENGCAHHEPDYGTAAAPRVSHDRVVRGGGLGAHSSCE